MLLTTSAGELLHFIRDSSVLGVADGNREHHNCKHNSGADHDYDMDLRPATGAGDTR